MNEPNVREYNGFFIYENPFTVNFEEWLNKYTGYDAVMKSEDENDNIVTILSFAEKGVSEINMKKWFRENYSNSNWTIMVGPPKDSERIMSCW